INEIHIGKISVSDIKCRDVLCRRESKLFMTGRKRRPPENFAGVWQQKIINYALNSPVKNNYKNFY
ncbi:MAG: hypothetical protein LBI03_06360, partial [Clostridiales bacterium]|nr:hypothetical protein [Clostridiales bacterium]